MAPTAAPSAAVPARTRSTRATREGHHAAIGDGPAWESRETEGQHLLLDIDVLPEPRDSPFVRYLALVGMLAAIVLLVAYLLLR